MDADIPQAQVSLSNACSLTFHEFTWGKLRSKYRAKPINTTSSTPPTQILSMGTIGDICVSPNPDNAAASIQRQARSVLADLGTTITNTARPNSRRLALLTMRLRFDATHAPSYYRGGSASLRTVSGSRLRGNSSGETAWQRPYSVSSSCSFEPSFRCE